jgi:hypothetical protein
MRVERITRYPVKGLSPEHMDDVELTAGGGLPHDRRFAFAQGDSPFDPAQPAWLPKRNFACLMANAKVAGIRSAYDPHAHALSLRAEGMRRCWPICRTRRGAKRPRPGSPPSWGMRRAARCGFRRFRAMPSPTSRTRPCPSSGWPR